MKIRNGGIMVNYRCTAACRHCLYACSPTRAAGYITGGKMREVCVLLDRGGCRSVHIGGGEPFLDCNGLITVIRELRNAGIMLDYIETNAYWAANDGLVSERLEMLMDEGADTLCISLDPFHAEYVPYEYPLRLAHLCEQRGMGFFLWKQQFLPALSRLDGKKPHDRAELEQALSPGYIGETAHSYGIHHGGRAVNIEEEYRSLRPAAELLDDVPCGNLLSGDHFHVDKDGFFIPSGCTGLRLPLAEVVNTDTVPPGTYPVFEALYKGGIRELRALARQYEFTERESGYASKCNMCFHIRAFLSKHGFAELDEEHYAESLRYY
ncbi:radical SAM protein [Spirochaetia bacterium]|nr:radical SAM protein [Spirochaetia bacterium]